MRVARILWTALPESRNVNFAGRYFLGLPLLSFALLTGECVPVGRLKPASA
jgi:hypothetical protein